MDSGTGSRHVGKHLLGPHVVGQRVVVRRVLRGEFGPSGGPAMTDVLGVCTTWGPDSCVVESDAGPVTIALADIVSGKPVPPRPSVRHRVSPRDAQLHGASMWAGVETRELGDWMLRSAPGVEARRANSVLAMGEPDRPWAEAVAAVLAFYRQRQRPALACVEAESAVERALTAEGWVPHRPGASNTLFQIASLATARRALRGRLAPDLPEPDVEPAEPGRRATLRIGDRARAQGAIEADWLGIHALEVEPAHRRQGLALALLDGLLEWGAEHGATTAYLQVYADNAPALSLYESLGFATHHAYRYLAAPS